VAWFWTALILVGGSAVVAAAISRGVMDAQTWGYVFLAFLYAILGLLVALRGAGNSIGWILFILATSIVLDGAANVRIDGKPDPVAVWDLLAIVWLNTGYFVGILIPLFLLFYIFPTGRFLNRRWRWAGWVAAIIVPVAFVTEGFGRQIGPDAEDWTVANPVGFLGPGGLDNEGVITFVFGIGLVLLMAGAVPAIVVRYRRAETEVRAQIKWVLYALILFGLNIAMAIFWEFDLGVLEDILFILSLALVPIAIAFAITRYNLYEIDRLISRTVSYVVVVAVLASVYAAGAIWLPTKLSDGQSPIFVAGSTLAVAGLFNPLRKRIQHLVDRRFNRSSYEAEAIADRFSAELQETLTVDQISALWTETVTAAVEPSAAGIWLKSDARHNG
jgi:hypothetical protein